jgi:phosphoribosyl-AMP cyclohydrolase
MKKEHSVSLSDELKYDTNGLITAVVQDAETSEVLMVAYMNKEAVDRTLESGKTCFWSRSRQEFWVKGGSSGHFQLVKGVYADCDRDCLLVKVDQTGAACHDGYRSCFYRRVADDGSLEVVAEKVFDPKQVYGK